MEFLNSKYGWIFIVEGRGHFPLDMLRRDSCFPTDEGETYYMRNHNSENAQVTLKTHQPFITEGRWNSFGWKIIHSSPLDKAGYPKDIDWKSNSYAKY